jgi:hypothetical protein
VRIIRIVYSKHSRVSWLTLTCRHDYDLAQTFEVLVGKEPSQARFTVHQDLIVKRSEFFRAARSSLWTSPDVPTTLDDQEYDPEILSAYLHCLYFGADAIRDRLNSFRQQVEGSHSDSSPRKDNKVPLMEPEKARTTVFVSNLSDDVTDSQLAHWFTNRGVIPKSVSIATRPDGCSRGFGFLEYRFIPDAIRAIQLGGRSIDGRRICLDMVDNVQSDSDGSSSDGNSSDDSSSETPESHACDHRGCCQHFAGARELKFLVDLYLLADKFIDPSSANLTMDVLTAHLQFLQTVAPGSMFIKFVYDSTTCDNPLRRLIRDWYIHRADYDWVDGFDKLKYHDEFVHDVVREVWTLNRVNLDRSVRDVYESNYMNQPGDRYHQRVDKVLTTCAERSNP